MKKQCFLWFVIFLFSSCGWLSQFGENLDEGRLQGFDVSILPSHVIGDCQYNYDDKVVFKLIFTGKLDFNKYEYYDFRASFHYCSPDVDFRDEGNNILTDCYYEQEDGSVLTKKQVYFRIEEKDCKIENMINKNEYSFKAEIPLKVEGPCNNQIDADICTEKAGKSWCLNLDILPSE